MNFRNITVHMTILVRVIILGILIFIPAGHVGAQVCYPSRVIDQWSCLISTLCQTDPQSCCLSGGFKCSGSLEGCDPDNPDCTHGGVYPDAGTCRYFCDDWDDGSVCSVTDALGSCSSVAEGCNWVGTVTSCSYISDVCTESNSTLTYGCWGPGDTPTPTAGPTPTPGGPTPTPIVLCPNGGCDIEETCSSCPADCGVCPPATLTARAVTVGSDTSCTAVAASTDYLSGTAFSLSPKCIRRLAASP